LKRRVRLNVTTSVSVIVLIQILFLLVSCGEKNNQNESDQSPRTESDEVASKKMTICSAFRKVPLIYIVDSYNPENFSWTREINRGIIEGLKEFGFKEGVDFNLIRDTIDAYVNAAPRQMEEQGYRILEDIEAKQPDIVLTTDDDALMWVGLNIDDIPVVFNGVNGDPRKYLSSPKIDSIKKPGHNITGVYQTTYFKQSLILLKKLDPEAETFAVISDKTTTGKVLLDAFRQLDSNTLPLKWEDTFVSEKYPEWKVKINEWSESVDVLFLLSDNAIYDEDGTLLINNEAVTWIGENSKIPSTSCWAYQVKLGILVSATDDGVMQGKFSAMFALQIFEGAHPGDIAIVTPPNGVPVLNLKVAKKLGITVPQNLMNMFIEDGIIVK